jgi:hypothetical protein
MQEGAGNRAWEDSLRTKYPVVAIAAALSVIPSSFAAAQETARPPRWVSSNLQQFECDGMRKYTLSSTGFPVFLELDLTAKRVGVSATFSGTTPADSPEPMVLTVNDGTRQVKSSSGFAWDKGPSHDIFASVSAMLLTSGSHKISIGVTTERANLDNQAVTVTMTCWR